MLPLPGPVLSQDKATGPESGVEDKGNEVRGGKVGRMMGCGSQTRALLSTLGGLRLWDRETLCDGSSEVREPPRERESSERRAERYVLSAPGSQHGGPGPRLIQDSSELFDAPSVGRWSLYFFLLWYELWNTSDGVEVGLEVVQ